jgi:small-conductance mechanosensitive channel
MKFFSSIINIIAISVLLIIGNSPAQQKNVPVIVTNDTLFYIRTSIGPFTAEQRVKELSAKLNSIIANDENPDSIRTEEHSGYTNIIFNSRVLMSVTDADAQYSGKNRSDLTRELISIIRQEVKSEIDQHSGKRLLINGAITLGLFLLLLILLWIFKKIFPYGYSFLEKLEGKIFRPFRLRNQEIISAENISAFFIFLLKGARLVLTLLLFYYFLTYSFTLFPWTKGINIKPIVGGIFSSVVLCIITYAVIKSAFIFFDAFSKKVESWKGSIIKSVKVKNLEVVSENRIIDQIKFAIKILKFLITVIIAYFFVTILFSFFSFSENWASTLIGYILQPLLTVLQSFISFLPNLFTIIVIIFVTRYVLKFIKSIFNEIGKESIFFPKFPSEWAEPTYKIARFLLLAFAAIVIFPYLPGSGSPAFQGVSVFLGILFSIGSSSAIANMVAGVVLTYMRPFKIGDRVKIADTMGDIIEKTLLVTRVRTIKNVNVSIPNAMVLGSHIINFSSSAKEKGLILHTSVTIGYSVPWKKVNSLLLSAASGTENILKEPAPFILQTSLDDSYVSYELNVYTDKPGIMAQIYSDLHQNIQDKFNEAGVEIMSPHYSAVRDGNATAIPDEYLPKGYTPQPFRILPLGNIFKPKGNADKNEE